MKKLFITILCGLISLTIYSQNLISDSKDIKVDLNEIHAKSINEIYSLLDKMDTALVDLERKNSIDKSDIKTNSITLNGVVSQIHDIKSKIDNYKVSINNSKELQVIGIQKDVDLLLKELTNRENSIKNLDNQNNKEVANIILSYISDVRNLSQELTIAKKDIEDKNKDIAIYKQKEDILKITSDSLRTQLKLKEIDLKYLTGGPFKIGLAAGLNYEFTGEVNYIINNDKTARKINNNGMQGMLSAVILYHPDSLFKWRNNLDFILNIPIAAFGFGDNQTINSIFNKTMPLGLGLGYQLSANFSVFGVCNVSRIPIIDDETLKVKKFNEEPLTIIDTEKYSTTTITDYSLFFGFLYKFGNGNKK